jgi:3-methyladenine DNA glycosylase AlkD
MMTAMEILNHLKPLGADSYRKILLKHGVKEPVFGVKIEELKKIQKRVKKDFQLSLDLYETGVYDAQYLAGLIADETKMTSKILRQWLATANSSTSCGFAVAWVTAESPDGWDLAIEWIGSKNEMAVHTGWATLSSLVSIKDDAELDLKELKRLLAVVEKTIHTQPNLVRKAMNGFVISLGSCVKALTDLAIKTGEKIGPVSVDVGDTDCKVPYAPDSIRKVQQRGNLGKKRMTARC